MPGGGALSHGRPGEKAGAAMKKMFSCSSNQVAVESWNKQDQRLLDAVERGDVGKVSLLVSKKAARPTKANALGQSAFHLAAAKGLTECLTVLLSHGADANAANEDSSTALHLATIACQPQCVKVLLQHGANEDCLDGQNRTPLHWAALSGCASSVLLLCDQEASLDAADDNGRTPLMAAAQAQHPAVCAQLLQRGAQVDAADRDGKTALIIACESGSTEVAELLLQGGANVARADVAGHDALHYARRAKDRALRRLVRGALRKWRKREQGLDPSSEASSQVPSESERETATGSSQTLRSEARAASDGEEEEEEEEEEGSELKEWRTRYREEKGRVIQLELQLAQKAKECQALSAGCQAMKERVWDQVQEIHRLLPEGDGPAQEGKEPSRRYSRDSTEEDYYLNLLATQVQELKKRTEGRAREAAPKAAAPEPNGPPEETGVAARWPGQEEEEEGRRRQSELARLRAEVAAAVEEKAAAERRLQEVEGHMDNMRAVIGVYEARRKSQLGAARELEGRLRDLAGENRRLRGLLAKRPAASLPATCAIEKVAQFLADLEVVYSKVQRESCAVMAENAALKREAEEALRGPPEPRQEARKAAQAWKAALEGLEGAVARLGHVNACFLEKGKALREALVDPRAVASGHHHIGEDDDNASREETEGSPGGSKSHEEPEKAETGANGLPNGSAGPVKLRPRPDTGENKANSCRKSSELEKEVWELKKNNGKLVAELARLSRERESLQEELRRWASPKEETPQAEVAARATLEELQATVDSLSRQLSAEREASRRLRLELEARKTEPEPVGREADGGRAGAESLDSSILEELHWTLDKVEKKVVSEMEAEDLPREEEEEEEEKTQLDVSREVSEAAGDNAGVQRRMAELERGLRDLEQAAATTEAAPGGLGHQDAAGRLRPLLRRLAAQVAGLRCEEEEALGRQEKVRAMLSVRAQALGAELASLQERQVALSRDCAARREALAGERQRSAALRAEAAECRAEAEELRGKAQAAEGLAKKVEELTKACHDREAKIKKLLKETEKLSSEILNLRSERAQLQLHIEVVQKNHQEIVAIYRTHLLNAAQGFMEEDVHAMLLRILQANR